ncbi:secreted RxLR effector peptide protein, putative [Phytophthora infestans T30-4]|uniref:Secreted RxLR effector peptide protein, putative n=1 Tax=Phytophthora infestans (strain T30-4) TaxID=403677 RepID=D0NBT8_PHYIT|nr:secreted RxLR effector peptide protein, putative [Phytophthora infestans T30-4]EEY55243.1 secreted RxLR effector peptide protein, putative [Phytophthora infestans T30-4]|eukprot:XP_002903467.1 secreted RxLR effector peptide protein, putative [Phytophthora infestans T30-4]
MRFYFILLLVGSVLCALLAHGAALVEIGEVKTSSGFESLGRSSPLAKRESPSTQVVTDQDAEERSSVVADLVRLVGVKLSDKVRARYWLWRGKSSEDVFKRLKLDGGLEKLMENPKFFSWMTYINMYNKKNPDKKMAMTDVLTKTYGDLALSRMLDSVLNARRSSQKSRKLMKVAATLALQQRQGWERTGKSTDEIFAFLS